MISKKIDSYLLCLEEQRFFDAHETLEEIWFPLRFINSNEVKLLKGFINAAVSFELHKRGRIVQSKKVWANYLKYRQLLYKTESKNLNIYHKLALHIETINSNKTTIILPH